MNVSRVSANSIRSVIESTIATHLHQGAKRFRKLSLVAEWIVVVDLRLVRTAREESAEWRSIGEALQSRVHEASVAYDTGECSAPNTFSQRCEVLR